MVAVEARRIHTVQGTLVLEDPEPHPLLSPERARLFEKALAWLREEAPRPRNVLWPQVGLLQRDHGMSEAGDLCVCAIVHMEGRMKPWAVYVFTVPEPEPVHFHCWPRRADAEADLSRIAAAPVLFRDGDPEPEPIVREVEA